MRRNYEVYIDGRRLTIVGTPEGKVGRATVERQEVPHPADVFDRVQQWQRNAGPGSLQIITPDAEEAWDRFCSHYRFVPAAGGCVTDEHRRLLAIQRLGVWDLPKGKVDPGEPVDAAAVREVHEECGLQRVDLLERLCDTWHTYVRDEELHLKRTDWYLMRASSSQPLIAQAEEGITGIEWMDAAGIAELKKGTYPSLLVVIAAWERAIHRLA